MPGVRWLAMFKRNCLITLSFLMLVSCAGCVELKKADDTWESSGPIKIRLQRKYHLGNDYYLFDVLQNDTGRWNRRD